MHPELTRWTRAGWRVITGAPVGAQPTPRERWVRTLPVALPLATAAMLLGWNHLWRQPRLEAYRDSHRSVLQLEEEVETLTLAYSANQAAELARQAGMLAAEIGRPGDRLANRAAALQAAAAKQGWSIQFAPPVLLRPAGPAGAPPPILGHDTLRARLTPLPENDQPLASLRAWLDDLSALRPRIDLIQLAISADERGWQGVEVHLRSAYRLLDATPSQ